MAATEVGADFHSFVFGRERIDFTLTFGDRKRLKITVHPDQRVTVDAPLGSALEDVLERVRRRAPWIAKQRLYFERFHPVQPPRQYVSGETHLYLGRQYRLKVVEDGSETVKLVGRYLRVFTRRPADRHRVEALVKAWFREHAVRILSRRLARCLEDAGRIGVSAPRVRFQTMKGRWGSCSSAGTITLNTELAKAPLPCIDYVLFHEICHLKHPHHGKDFYRLLSRFVPHWERWKERLEMVSY